MHRPGGIRAIGGDGQEGRGARRDAADEIAVCSTGLIGELLPLDHVLSGVESAYAALSDDDQAGSDASHAIMTTDTKPKTVSLEGDGYRIGGMVKGSA